MMPDLSAFVLTQNNLRTIKACLDSLTWCPQVVVIDSFSTDGTVEIVKSYPNTMLWQHQYSNAQEQRIWGMQHVKSKWTLIIDSDELCPSGLRDVIQDILKDENNPHDGYIFLTRTMFMGRLLKHQDYMSSKGKRLVLTSIATRYWRKARVHASIRLDHRKIMPERYYLIHDPIDSLDAHFAKMRRYARWQAEDMYEKGKKTRWWHLTLRPVGKLLQYYLMRGAFRDGWRGLMICAMGAVQVSLKYLLLAELEHGSGSGSE
jgi:glycosyltransferase involved in cell wall biosynthesis